MNKFRITTIVGARPQFIKASVVSREIKKHNNMCEFIIHTGQHYDQNMSDVFFKELKLPLPDLNLNIGSLSHGKQTGRMLEKIEEALLTEKPHLVLIYGDTNSTLAGALAAAKLHIPIAHVEAGLRSFNKRMPEEINRVLADHVADFLFCPTEVAVKNLQHEGISKEKIFLVGDVMYDAALFFAQYAESSLQLSPLKTFKLTPKNYILATIHRAENTDDSEQLKNLCAGLEQVAKHLPVVLPLHPRTRAALKKYDLLDKLSHHLLLIDPVSFLEMIILEKNAKLIITDSGGVQKEAYFYRVPCITVRDETEWTELVVHEWNHLCKAHEFKKLAQHAMQYIDKQGEEVQLYGDGQAAQKITALVQDYANTLNYME